VRPASRLALASLPLLALLTPERASALETEVAGKPLVVDVTNTSVLNYRFNNRNTADNKVNTILDDDYGEWLDRLNIQANYWKLRVGVRIDAATFFATPTGQRIRELATDAQPPANETAPLAVELVPTAVEFPPDAVEKVPRALPPAAVALASTPSATVLTLFETVPLPIAIAPPGPVADASRPIATEYWAEATL